MSAPLPKATLIQRIRHPAAPIARHREASRSLKYPGRPDIALPDRLRRFGRVEDGRGSLGHAATLRFPSPLIEPDVRISRIRLSDWLHREAHQTKH